MSIYATYPIRSSGVPIYPNLAAFPASAVQGALGVAADTGNLYEFNGTSWVLIAGGGGSSVDSIGPFGSTPNADGGSIAANTLTLQPASGSFPGGISTVQQSFAGEKDFLGALRTGTAAPVVETEQFTSLLSQSSDPGQNYIAALAWNRQSAAGATSSTATALGGNVERQLSGNLSETASLVGVEGGVNITTNGHSYTNASILAGVKAHHWVPAGGGTLNINQTMFYAEPDVNVIVGQKTALYLGAMTNATNNVAIADNFSVSGNWFLNSTSLLPSLLSGQTGIGSVNGNSLLSIGGGTNPLTGTTQRGVASFLTGTAANTSVLNAFIAAPTTGAAVANVENFVSSAVTTTGGAATRFTGFYEAGASAHSATNNASYADNIGFAGNWFINQSGSDPSTLGGALTLSSFSSAGLVTNSSAGLLSSLANGSNTQVLTMVAGSPAWASPATSGTVTSVSVVSANGLAGTVATATTTPAITLSTTITGILQGNGTAISAATTTGSGAVVLATSPTLVTPALGTPSALVGTNITGTASSLTAGNINASSNSTITTLSALSLPASQLTGTGNLTDAGTDGITVTGGTGAVIGTGTSLSQHVADTAHNGYLSSTDWNTFNGKQAAGNYITALTGDVTASGPGSAAATLATVATGATVGSSTSIPTFTFNNKGLVTSASGNAVIAPAGTLSGTTLNSTVVSSSLTSVGTLAGLSASGTINFSGLTASQAVFTDASKNLVSNAITGTGNVVMSTSPTLVTPALGTPSALVGTNITGTAAGLTAGTVTTNANLTGPITSSGNATSIASQTGTGTTFAMSVAPAITGAWTLTDAGTIINATTSSKVLALSLSGMTAARTLTLASNQTTTQTLTIPNITGADTLATLALAQTFSGADTFSASGTALTVTNNALVGGQLGVGAIGATALLQVGGGTNPLTGTTQRGIISNITGTSAATSVIQGLVVLCTSGAAVTNVEHYISSAPAATGGAITRFSAFYDAGAQTHVGTNNASFTDNIGFTGNYFINQSGSDGSVFAGPITPTGGLVGVTTVSNATAGNVGEYVKSTASGVSLTSATATNITSISLTAGDWDVSGVACIGGALTVNFSFDMAISTTSATLGTEGDTDVETSAAPTVNADSCQTIPAVRINVSSTTTVYLVVQVGFGAGTATGRGRISARRVR